MSFAQQADMLLELHRQMDTRRDSIREKHLDQLKAQAAEAGEDWRVEITLILPTNQGWIDDLWMIAQRLQRMAPHEDRIRRLVTGQ